MLDLRRFDLLFVLAKTVVGRVISEVTASPYSHVAIVLDEWHVAETDWRYPLQPRHISYAPGDYHVYRCREELTDIQKRHMSLFLHYHLNTPYDLVQSISNGLHLIVAKFGIIDRPDRFNCSEAAARMYRAAGIEIPTTLTPGELSQLPIFIRVA